MALAIKFEGLLHLGEARDYADLARLALVTRARMTQIMALLNLAPDIQEEILFLPEITAGREPVTEPKVRRITKVTDWGRQRRMWGELMGMDAREPAKPQGYSKGSLSRRVGAAEEPAA